MTAQLKPCPFCGGAAEFERVGTGRQSCIVACTNCGCRLETSETWSSGTAWNGRAGAALEAECAALLQQRGATPAHLQVALANAARAFQRGDLAALATVNEALQPLVDAAVSQIIGARSEVDRLRIRVAELEAPGECQSLHKLRAEVERLKARLL